MIKIHRSQTHFFKKVNNASPDMHLGFNKTANITKFGASSTREIETAWRTEICTQKFVPKNSGFPKNNLYKLTQITVKPQKQVWKIKWIYSPKCYCGGGELIYEFRISGTNLGFYNRNEKINVIWKVWVVVWFTLTMMSSCNYYIPP